MIETGSFLAPFLEPYIPWLYADSFLWTSLGLLGNVLFTARILVQWWATEKRKAVIVPDSYWWLSFLGGVLNMVYAFHLDKLPVIIGAGAVIIYARNIWFMLVKHAHPAN
jgi:lipid-A-disaccharide synthase-like uncharacterized protein